MKNRPIFSMVILLFISMNCLAVETPSVIANDTIKAKAMRQFKESVARLQRCVKGHCSQGEVLKAARDVSITAAVFVVALYAARAVIYKMRKRDSSKISQIAPPLVKRKDNNHPKRVLTYNKENNTLKITEE
jgi:hypothetical protein